MRVILTTILERLGLAVLTLFIVSVLIFSSVTLLPGGFATAVLGQSATPETVAAFEEQIGLDRPATERYFDWLGGAVRGDFGNSYSSRPGSKRRVVDIIAPRLLNTLKLAGLTAAIAVPFAIFLGIITALWRNSWFDRVINAATLTTISVPEFFVAYVLILFLAVKFPIFRSLSTVRSHMGVAETLENLALPVLTLALVITAHMMRMTRAAIIGVLGSPYIEMAKLKGAPPLRIVLRHALPNALAPIANVVAFNLGYLIVGAVIIEFVFVYPGIGQALVDAVRTRDVPVVQACALLFALTYIALNLIADLIAIATNPRLLHPR
ncbi:ABC transporter permease [Mesorhizobium sp. 2RAF21]|uniref:ABC transporter permease n=1 Tax=Mesorhizobium sp. 2RAF21 TaxID=3232995 RepID=UPI003F9B5885